MRIRSSYSFALLQGEARVLERMHRPEDGEVPLLEDEVSIPVPMHPQGRAVQPSQRETPGHLPRTDRDI